MDVGAADGERELCRRLRRRELVGDGKDLHRELARRLDDNRAHLIGSQRVGATANHLEDGYEECECLAAACCRLHDDVLVAEQPRNCGLLDGSGSGEVVLGEGCEEGRR